MHALRAHTRGGPEMLVYEQAPTPIPGDGEVLVEVHAAAITFDELVWDETWTRDGVDRTPIIPSHEFSGVIADTGQEVYGLVPFDRDGAAAEYVCVPVSQIAPKPARLSHVEAAALPLPALTARQALDRAEVTADDLVLVHGAAGAVGGYATQMAVAMGAEVTVTAVSAIDYVQTLGAQRVIDVRTEPFDSEPGAYDVVIDTVGGQTLDRSYAVLCEGGRLVTLQTPPDLMKADQFGIVAIFFIVATNSDELARLARFVDDGQLRVTVAATFPLADGRAAYASRSALNRRPGKTVLTVRP